MQLPRRRLLAWCGLLPSLGCVRVSLTSTSTGSFPSSYFEAASLAHPLLGAPGLGASRFQSSTSTQASGSLTAQLESRLELGELAADWDELFDAFELHLMQGVLDQRGQVMSSEVLGEGAVSELDLRYRIEGVDGRVSLALEMDAAGQPTAILIELRESVQ